MTLMFRTRWVVAALALGLVGIAPVSVAQTPPTNLQVSNFHYSATAKEHRFTFTWDAAQTAAKAPYPSYQLSLGKSCGYES